MINIDKLQELERIVNKQSKDIARIIEKYNKATLAIQDIKFLKQFAGGMFFTGTSGKIGEENIYLKYVKLNDIGGCVRVPDLLLDLANRRLLEIENEIEILLNEYPIKKLK